MDYKISGTALFGYLLLWYFCFNSSAFGQTSAITAEVEQKMAYQDEISIEYMRDHLEFIASDRMQGRNTGSKQLKQVSDYLAREYEHLGLKPAVGDTGYLQPYELESTIVDSITFAISNKKQNKSLLHFTAKPGAKAPFVQLFGGNKPMQGDIVFAGFGINDPDHNVAHMGDMDLENKWVMVYENIPSVVDGDTLVNPSINTRQRFQDIIMGKKAKGMIIIGLSNDEFKQRSARQASTLGKADNMRLAYRKQQSQPGWSYLVINNALAKKLLGLPPDYPLDKHRQHLQNNISKFEPAELPHRASITNYTQTKAITAHNVAAIVEGSDPKLKNEFVIITAHHDHLGVGQPDSTGDAIYNGADDDGSGTVALLNIAKALQAAQEENNGPKRSVMLLHVSGEEKGLLGSRYYSDHPEKPIEQTIANLNIDMIGRVDKRHEQSGNPNYVYIIGGDIISSGLDSLITLGNQHSGNITLSDRYNDLQDPNQFYRRSDHWNFGRLGVPFAFFFSGVHEDYHQPSDEIAKIQFEKMSRIVRTIYGAAIMLTETAETPVVDNQAFIMTTKLQER